MSWLKYLAGFLLFIQLTYSDVKISWSDKFMHGQVLNVLYGSAVQFRCNGSIDNLYEVSKEEYDKCEPLMNQHSRLNCTRDTPRGRDIYNIIIVEHDVQDAYYKDYSIGQNYYFICASDMSENGESSVPDPGGSVEQHNPGTTTNRMTDNPGPPRGVPNANYTNVVETGEDTAHPEVVQVADTSNVDNSSVSAGSSRVLALLLLTLVYILNS